jgi:hypothetical protein
MRTDAAIKLQRWAELEERLEEIKATELALRNEIFSEIFAEPKEGKNVAPLENGWKLEGTLRYNRSIDEAALANVSEMPGMRKIVAAVIKYKPSLDMRTYKALADGSRLALDTCITAKPGTPSLKIVGPKEAKK